MRRLAFAILCFAASAGCGPDTADQPRRSPRPGAAAGETALPLLPLPITSPAGVTDAAPGGVTGAVALVGPAVPERTALVRLLARLGAGASSAVTTLTATHPGEALAPAAVPPGEFTLTYLDENGLATGVNTSVTVTAGQTAVVRVGAVQVSPASAVRDDRTGSQALVYRIAQGTQTLKRVRADLGATVVLPPGEWTWTAQAASGGELAGIGVTVPAGALVTREWGSVFVRKNAVSTVALQTPAGLVVFPQTTDGVEYLLPATDQAHGCMIYLGVVNLLTIDTITLCQDAVMHVELRTR